MNKTYLLPLFLLGFSASAQVIEVEEKGDYPVEVMEAPNAEYISAGTYKENGKSGFVFPRDVRQGTIYDDIQWASDGFIVKKNNLFGIANKKGELIGKIEFDSIGSDVYKTGPGFVVKQKKKYGKISVNGEVLLPIKYDRIIGGNNHITVIKNSKNATQLIFNKQNKLLPKKIEYAAVYQNVAIVKTDGKYGVIKDQTIIPFEYDSIFIPIRNQHYNNYNNKPQQKVKAPNLLLQSSQNIPYLTIQKGNKFGLIDANGTIIYPAENDAVFNADSFGYYSVKKGDFYGIYFSNSTNKKKTEIEFDRVFTDGYGAVMASKNKKAGIFNLQGEQIAPFEYDTDFIAQYSGIGYQVAKDRKKGILDKQGKVIVPPIYDDIDTFYETGYEDLLKVKSGEKFGLVTRDNRIVVPAEFEHISVLGKLLRVVKGNSETNRKFGLYNHDGKMVIPVEYDWITDSDTPDSKLIILKKNKEFVNFLDAGNNLIFAEGLSEYGYILNQENLLNPFSYSNKKNLLFVKDIKGKIGIFEEFSKKLVVPIIYDAVLQRFEIKKNTYISIRKGNKVGLIDEMGQIVIPFKYDTINLDFLRHNYENESDNSPIVVVSDGNKFGAVDLKNNIVIPFEYKDLKRISYSGLFKAKKGKYYQIINAKNKVINEGPFDEIANFESLKKLSNTESDFQAYTFYKGNMRVVNSKGVFLTREVPMQPHDGFKTFDELKFALVKALDDPKDDALNDFVLKIAPSEHLLDLLKNTDFKHDAIKYANVKAIREKYLSDLKLFKYRRWNTNSGYSYNKSSLKNVTDYTSYSNSRGYVTNERRSDWAFGDNFMEKLLRNAIKINGYWISSYFMSRGFESYEP
ncbi:WG repeat-containing protein [Flavobacterium pedocola]